MDQFADIIEYATVYLKHSAQSKNAELRSSFNPGVLPPLYFCALKCRDPILRREALSLMQQTPPTEDLWAFFEPARVIARLISVEEGDSSEAVSDRPPERRRFNSVNVMSRQRPSGKQCLALELIRFEYAADGSRNLIHEYAWLDDKMDTI
jgi:hypothetical protein